MAERHLAAIDLGAESGRVMLAHFDGQRLTLEEVHRFPNRPIIKAGHRHWNIQALWNESLNGLRKARQTAGTLDSIGVDSWAVDYGLLNAAGSLLEEPFHYRDQRTAGIIEQVCSLVPRAEIYAQTGIQFLPINTLYQLYAHEHNTPGTLAQAQRLLLIPDLFHYWLSGSQVSERTNASTTQCWNPQRNDWAHDLLSRLQLPGHMLPAAVEAGTSLGQLSTQWRSELGDAQIIAPATHDTGSAIAAIPATATDGWGYISSGTWSLVGIELPQPLITSKALAANFTNEGGVFGTTRFLKNVMGMWLLQECLRSWELQGDSIPYETLLAQIDTRPTFAALINPDDPRFLAPDDMPARINSALHEQGKTPLQSPAAFARSIMESLVLRYSEVFQQISQLTGQALKQIYVLGGGSRNAHLNQWLADALEIPVVAGPSEATAQGNALLQLVGLGELHSLYEIRTVAQQVETQIFWPQASQHQLWAKAAQRFHDL